jgi:predicted Ser/Thr protein kinase
MWATFKGRVKVGCGGNPGEIPRNGCIIFLDKGFRYCSRWNIYGFSRSGFAWFTLGHNRSFIYLPMMNAVMTGDASATISDESDIVGTWTASLTGGGDLGPEATIRPTVAVAAGRSDTQDGIDTDEMADSAAVSRGNSDASAAGSRLSGILPLSHADTDVLEPGGSGGTSQATEAVVPDAALSIALAADQRYRLLRPLATGGMGVVLVAEQASLNREVAVKIIKPELAHGRMLANFIAEARCNANLEHPNIVPVYDAGKNFLVMKRIRGSTLEDLIRKGHGADRLPDLVEILLKVCDAVAFAHSKGIIHRDLKPENVMVGEFGEVILMDWGLALAVSEPPDGIIRAMSPKARELMCAGTPGCMAPEMARANPDMLSVATDVFLLGAMLYRTLTARFPFQGKATIEVISQAARNDFIAVLRVNPRAPLRLVAVQARAMQADPVNRGTVAEFAAGLRAWLQTAGSEREALAASLHGQELLLRARAAAADGGNAQEAHRCFAGALAACDRAVSLCPDIEEYRQLRIDTQNAYSRLALSSGDLMLAKLLVRGTPVHLGQVVVDAGFGGGGSARRAATSTSMRAMSAYAGAITERLTSDLAESRAALEQTRRLAAWLAIVGALLLTAVLILCFW